VAQGFYFSQLLRGEDFDKPLTSHFGAPGQSAGKPVLVAGQ